MLNRTTIFFIYFLWLRCTIPKKGSVVFVITIRFMFQDTNCFITMVAFYNIYGIHTEITNKIRNAVQLWTKPADTSIVLHISHQRAITTWLLLWIFNTFPWELSEMLTKIHKCTTVHIQLTKIVSMSGHRFERISMKSMLIHYCVGPEN